MKQRSFFAIVDLALISLLVISNIDASTSIVTSLATDSENPISGAYVDKVVYKTITDANERILNLQAGLTDTALGTIDPIHVETLEADPSIQVHSMPRNGYGHITINCRDYPLNISGLRRAFAFAFDKTRVTAEVMDGHAYEHDSLVPLSNSWCIEDELPWHYYNNQSQFGNQILNSLNFSIDGGTGYRRAPDGTPFDIVVIYVNSAIPGISLEIAQLAVDALESLHIDASVLGAELGEFIARQDNHGSYDMAFYAQEFYNDNVDWLAYDYWSDYATIPYQNPSNFANSSYDEWRDQLLTSVDYNEVFEAASMMQKILHENVPRLVVYDNKYYQAYRTDRFSGYVADNFWGVSGPWSNLKVLNKTLGPLGGMFKVSVPSQPDTFNIFKVDEYSEMAITDNIYSSLCKLGPDMMLYKDLATDIEIESHSSNPSVSIGQTWVTVIIRQNAIWSDLLPLTVDDIVATFTYIQESGTYGNMMADQVPEMLSYTMMSNKSVRLVFDTESWWDIREALLAKIIPRHIFNEEGGIGYDEWSSWNPVFGTGPQVTCGPFSISDHTSSTVELTRNFLYHWPSGTTPKVLSAENVTYVQGTTGNQIIWEVSDENPAIYAILQGANIVKADIWNESTISYNIDGLAVGVYNFTLTAIDYSLNMATSTIWVTVTAREGGLPDILLLGVGIGSVVVLLGIAVAIWKKR